MGSHVSQMVRTLLIMCCLVPKCRLIELGKAHATRPVTQLKQGMFHLLAFEILVLAVILSNALHDSNKRVEVVCPSSFAQEWVLLRGLVEVHCISQVLHPHH